MTDEEKAIATRVAEAAFPIFLAREINADGTSTHSAENSWVVAEMFIQSRQQFIAQEEAKQAEKDGVLRDPSNLTPHEKRWIEANEKIQAIKEIRQRTGCSLTDAKAAADAYQNTLGAPITTFSAF